MKQRKIKKIIFSLAPTLFLVMGLLLFLPDGINRIGEAQAGGTCPFTPKEGRTIVNFDTKIRSDMDFSNAFVEKSVNLPAGLYKITTFAYDGYPGRENVSQPNEIWKVVLKNNNNVIAETRPTTDLADYVAYDEKIDLVAENLIVSSNITSVMALHPRYPDTSSANSVFVGCIAFDFLTPPTVDLKANGFDGPITIAYNTAATLTWTSSNANSCSASGDWSGSKPLSGSETTGNLLSSKTYTITCTGPGGSASDSVAINVNPTTLFVSLSSSPSSGCVPLTAVDLIASVSGTASGEGTFFFDCTNDGIWERITNFSVAYDLCNYSSVGTYTPKVRVEKQGLAAESTSQINVLACYSPPTVDIKANNSDGPITIAYNTAATLTWTSSNANSCSASGDWSGSKPLSGSELTGGLISSKSYSITCSGPGGSSADSVIVNVSSAPTLTVNKLVRNLTDGTVFLNSVSANPAEVLIFRIEVKAENTPLSGAIVKETLPGGLIYIGELKIDDVSSSGNILTGLNIGNLAAGQRKIITFRADVAGPESFGFGQTELTNNVSVSTAETSRSDTAKVVVSKTAVAGAVTTIPTGITDNIFFDSFFLPLVLASLVIWLFKSKILRFEEWLDARKRDYQAYKSKKNLQIVIAKIKAREFFRKLI